MSEPTVAPAPAAAAPTAPATPPAAPAAAPAQPASATDLAAENARLQAELETWKGHSRTWEQRAKAKADQEQNLAKVAQALGLEGATPDPATLAQQAAAAQARAAALARENAVLLAAQQTGADPAALLDSRAFLAQLENVDPTDRAAVAAAVQAAVAANPRYAAQPAPAPAPVAAPQQPAAPAPRQASAAGQFGQPAVKEQWTAEDVAKASPAALSKAAREGRLTAYYNS